jgi:hypothetical protein
VRGNSLRALFPALGVLALVGVVAVASTGSTPTGDAGARAPAESILDTIISFMLVALIPAAAILVYGLMQREAIAREIASGRYRRMSFLGFAVFMVLLTLVFYFRLRDWNPPQFVDEIGEQAFPSEQPAVPEPGKEGTTYDAEFAWIPVLVLLGLVAVAAAALFLSARRQKAALGRDDETIAEALVSALDDSLDDLRAETDPRRAVIAAYARLERVLAAYGRPRLDFETPQEFLVRILPGLDVDRRSVRRLTGLFMRAKFSQHEVDADMKEEAIGALAQVRDELRASAEARERAAVPSLRAGEGPA